MTHARHPCRALSTARCLAALLAAATVCLSAGPVRAQQHGGDDELARFRNQQISVLVGPSPYGWNFVSLKKDLYRDRQTSVFVTGGLGSILLGGGAILFIDGRDADSLVFSGVIGIVGAHAGVSYQFRLDRSNYVHLGAHVGNYFMQHSGLMPIVSWEHRL